MYASYISVILSKTHFPCINTYRYDPLMLSFLIARHCSISDGVENGVMYESQVVHKWVVQTKREENVQK